MTKLIRCLLLGSANSVGIARAKGVYLAMAANRGRKLVTAVQRSVLEGCVQIATPAGKVALGKAIEDSCDAKSLTL